MSPTRVNLRLLINQIAREFTHAGLVFGHGTARAIDEAAWLVSHVLEVAPEELAGQLDRQPSAKQTRAVEALAAQRIETRKPLAYLLREAWFAGLRFYVDERVIVPRSLTAEFILDRFSPWIDVSRVRHICDLCTGSGCMAVAVARTFPEAQVDAVDISTDALDVARINIARHGVQGRVRLIESDLFAGLEGRRYDVILSNPPYVATEEIAALPPEYRHEPALALDAGRDGLCAVRRILAQAANHLEPGGILLVEVGAAADALQAAFPRLPFTWLATEHGDDSVFLLTAGQLEELRIPQSARQPS